MNWKNKDERREYNKRYRNATRERRRECQREYRKRNKDLLNAKSKEYRSKKALEESHYKNIGGRAWNSLVGECEVYPLGMSKADLPKITFGKGQKRLATWKDK